MDIYLSEVEYEEKETLYRLLQYLLYEQSQYDLNETNNKAVFEYKYFDCYFTDNDRQAYFIKEQETDKLLGFAMVNSYMQKYSDGHSIAEFLVLPKYRRKKIGKKVAFELFNKYPGNWEVKPATNSEKAYMFWKNVIEEYTNKKYRFEDGIFLFNRL